MFIKNYHWGSDFDVKIQKKNWIFFRPKFTSYFCKIRFAVCPDEKQVVWHPCWKNICNSSSFSFKYVGGCDRCWQFQIHILNETFESFPRFVNCVILLCCCRDVRREVEKLKSLNPWWSSKNLKEEALIGLDYVLSFVYGKKLRERFVSFIEVRERVGINDYNFITIKNWNKRNDDSTFENLSLIK
jgi:hypothetical protein